jgi:hypothetical protein
MRTLTLNLTEEAYQTLKAALTEHDDLAVQYSVSTWLESELNANADVIVEMLLGDY